jgi:hypothetical protein
MSRVLLCLLITLVLVIPVCAQDIVTDVYVTTQDYSSFRTGPGRGFERLKVIDPAMTLPAIGRTADTQWVQVVHEGQRGWIASTLLIWSGDIIRLPVDGVDPNPFIRRAGAVAVTTRETPTFAGPLNVSDQVGSLPAGTSVELTGRLGGDRSGYFRFQIMYEGQLYWIGSWDVYIDDGDYRRLLDISTMSLYGRLTSQYEESIAIAVSTYSLIDNVWQRLAYGEQVSCSPIPPYARRTISDANTGVEPAFAPALIALDAAIDSTNRAISLFEDLCNSTRPLTEEDIHTASVELDTAYRNLILASSLLQPLRVRNPLLQTISDTP